MAAGLTIRPLDEEVMWMIDKLYFVFLLNTNNGLITRVPLVQLYLSVCVLSALRTASVCQDLLECCNYTISIFTLCT